MQSKRSIWTRVLFALQIAISTVPYSDGKSINWAGYDWILREERNSGPGPNNWSSNNVWLDNENHIHLKVAHSPSSGWSCAELYTTVKFGFGTYRFFVEGAVDRFDPNTILGIFTYGGQDGTNEIDIEVAEWGHGESGFPNLYFTVYPNQLGVKSVTGMKRFSLNGTYTTHQFTWTRDHVSLQSQNGFPDSPTDNIFFSYQTPDTFTPHMPVESVPLHINLWNFEGRQPIDGKEVEIVIHDFKYTKSTTENFLTTEDPLDIDESSQSTRNYVPTTIEEHFTTVEPPVIGT